MILCVIQDNLFLLTRHCYQNKAIKIKLIKNNGNMFPIFKKNLDVFGVLPSLFTPILLCVTSRVSVCFQKE